MHFTGPRKEARAVATGRTFLVEAGISAAAPMDAVPGASGPLNGRRAPRPESGLFFASRFRAGPGQKRCCLNAHSV